MLLHEDPPQGGPSPPTSVSPNPVAATPEPPPGAVAASRLLWALGAPTVAALVLVPLHLGTEVVLGDPVLLLAVLLGAGTALLLTWNLVCMLAAHLATATLLPRGATLLLARFVQRVGTREARKVLARRGAVAALGTGLVLSVAPVAVALPVPTPVTAAATRGAPPTILPGAPAVSAPAAPDAAPGQDPVPSPPDDLTWGAPGGPGTGAGTPTPSTGSTSPAPGPARSTPSDADPSWTPGSPHGAARTSDPTPGVSPQGQGPTGTGRTLSRSPEIGHTGVGAPDPVLAGLRADAGPGAQVSSGGTGTTVGDPGTHSPTPGDTATAAVHVVVPGESLWTIAAQHLGADADDERIAALWPRIHADNAEIIGTDPGLIHPGTHLRIPGSRP